MSGRVLEFGVSGLLYESNLLMYDRQTESLWLQATGEAVVGELLGQELEVLPMQVMPFGEDKAKYHDAQVLSKDTGYSRNYDSNPYASYEDTDELLFDVSVDDTRFPAKEHMWVFEVNGRSVTFPVDELTDEGAEATFFGREVHVTREGSIIRVNVDGTPVAGFREMWFIWATFNQEDGAVWDLKE